MTKPLDRTNRIYYRIRKLRQKIKLYNKRYSTNSENTLLDNCIKIRNLYYLIIKENKGVKPENLPEPIKELHKPINGVFD